MSRDVSDVKASPNTSVEEQDYSATPVTHLKRLEKTLQVGLCLGNASPDVVRVNLPLCFSSGSCWVSSQWGLMSSATPTWSAANSERSSSSSRNLRCARAVEKSYCEDMILVEIPRATRTFHHAVEGMEAPLGQRAPSEQ